MVIGFPLTGIQYMFCYICSNLYEFNTDFCILGVNAWCTNTATWKHSPSKTNVILWLGKGNKIATSGHNIPNHLFYIINLRWGFTQFPSYASLQGFQPFLLTFYGTPIKLQDQAREVWPDIQEHRWQYHHNYFTFYFLYSVLVVKENVAQGKWKAPNYWTVNSIYSILNWNREKNI